MLDVVVYGATGFTGKLCAKYLKKIGVAADRWAIAGRNAEKLESVKQELDLDAAVQIIIADSSDRAALDLLVKQTTTVITTVGPFLKYGETLVAACADAGTHYVDITGEVSFMKWTYKKYDAAAKKSGARIVHACGYDSIPSDLGALMALLPRKISLNVFHDFIVVDYMRDTLGKPCGETKMVAKAMGSMSGGTLATAIGFKKNAKDLGLQREDLKGEGRNPYYLDPPSDTPLPTVDAGNDVVKNVLNYNSDLKTWQTPFVMAMINCRVVRKSNALTGYKYGANFGYSEAMDNGSLWKAMVMLFGLFWFGLVVAIAPVRNLCFWLGLLPTSGQGPSQWMQDNGFFVSRTVGRTDEENPVAVQAVVKSVKAGDPGYKGTAQMLCEAGLCLALDGAALPAGRAGILTPAYAMGQALVSRLNKSGMSLTVGLLSEYKKGSSAAAAKKGK